MVPFGKHFRKCMYSSAPSTVLRAFSKTCARRVATAAMHMPAGPQEAKDSALQVLGGKYRLAAGAFRTRQMTRRSPAVMFMAVEPGAYIATWLAASSPKLDPEIRTSQVSTLEQVCCHIKVWIASLGHRKNFFEC